MGHLEIRHSSWAGGWTGSESISIWVIVENLWRGKCVRRGIFWNVEVRVGRGFTPFNPYFVCNTSNCVTARQKLYLICDKKFMLIFGIRRLLSLKNCQMRPQNSFLRYSLKIQLFSKKLLNKKIFSIKFLIKKAIFIFGASILHQKWMGLHFCNIWMSCMTTSHKGSLWRNYVFFWATFMSHLYVTCEWSLF